MCSLYNPFTKNKNKWVKYNTFLFDNGNIAALITSEILFHIIYILGRLIKLGGISTFNDIVHSALNRRIKEFDVFDY